MVAIDRRLDLLTSELSARERAILILRAWCAQEPPDERLRRYCPPQDKAVMESLIGAFEHGTGETHGQLVILLEWVATLEAAVNSLRVFQVYNRRMKALEAVARRAVPPMPAPWRDRRQVPIGWGVLKDEGDPGPETWDEVWELEARDIQRNLALRWQELRSFELVYEEVGVALGEPVVHWAVKERLAWFGESVLRLHDVMGDLGHPFDLPEPDAEQLETTRGHFDWEVLRRPSEKHAREWMSPKQQEELEAFERDKAEQLRDRS